MISRVKGTQDFLDLSLWNFVISQLKQHVQKYHFTEIATPILEPLALFQRSLGVHTDVVSKEMFIITPHGEDQESICLRPEATASTVRAFIENGIQSTPWKVYSFGPMFRYERPQKGRYRQFHQITMEVIGSSSIAQDVLLMAMLDRFFHEVLNLNTYALTINFLGCAQDRQQYREKLKKFLHKHSADICTTCQVRKDTNSMRVFDCKNESCKQLYRDAPFIADNLCQPCAYEWQQVQDMLSLLSISHAYTPTLVRGLDYYNKTVFEFVSANLGAQNAFCGGGRYDQLATLLGARHDQPSVGAAIGIERLLLLLEPHRESLAIAQEPTLLVIMPLEPAYQSLALLVADTLQAAGCCVEVMLEGDSVKSMMRRANKMGATYGLLLGSDEVQTKTVMVKNMVSGQQDRVTHADLVRYFKK
jgi:histidyl-tRNA synthetase